MIISVGEILADMIGIKKDGVVFYERKAGGAPFNVACAAKKFGAEVLFVGSVGDDIIGEFLVNFAQGRNLDNLCISRDKKHNTTLAFVELDENGERNFCFHRKNTADYHLPNIPDDLIRQANIVHIGSLMLSNKIGLEYAEKLAIRVKNAGKLLSFDINFRSDIFKNKQSAISVYKKIIQHADIVKFSAEEVEVFTENYVYNHLKDKLVCISLGEQGSEWHYKGNSNCISSIKVQPVDTTGAGDAFFAGILSQLDKIPSERWTEDKLNEIFAFANVCGALNTIGRGAIDYLPELDAVYRALQK